MRDFLTNYYPSSWPNERNSNGCRFLHLMKKFSKNLENLKGFALAIAAAHVCQEVLTVSYEDQNCIL